MSKNISAALVGGALGAIFFAFFFNSSPFYGLKYSAPYTLFGGTIVEMNRTNKTITVQVASSFAFPDRSFRKIRFTYDEKSHWYSNTFAFHDDVVIARSATSSASRPLPPGTLVTISRDPDAASLRADAIMYLERTNI